MLEVQAWIFAPCMARSDATLTSDATAISSGAVERWAMSDLRMLLPAWHSATIDQSAAINELRAADEVASIDRLPAINRVLLNRNAPLDAPALRPA
jgi:hypothetical protein